MAKRKEKIYVLANGRKPMSFLLQASDTKRKRLIHVDDEKGGAGRALRYSINHSSPFIDEQQGESQHEPIEFVDGTLVVPNYKQNLQEFLRLHPHNGVKFHELDHEQMAKDEMKEFEWKQKALSFALNSDIEVLGSVARILMGSDVDKMTSSEIKRDCLRYAERDPEGFIDAMDDPDLGRKNVARRAISERLLGLRDNDTAIHYNFAGNKKRLMVVPFGVDPYTALEQYFLTDEGVELFKALKTELGVE